MFLAVLGSACGADDPSSDGEGSVGTNPPSGETSGDSDGSKQDAVEESDGDSESGSEPEPEPGDETEGGADESTGGAAPPVQCAFEGPVFDEAHLQTLVSTLASDAMQGRRPGSPGDLMTRAIIQEHFECLGLAPAADAGAYQQPFVDAYGQSSANVLAVLPGSDPQLANDVIVISAHHDHLGVLDGEVLNGANDNATGTVALMALAETFATLEIAPSRTLVFAAYGSEEVELDGSFYYVDNPPAALPMDRVVYNVNLDMIGTFTVNGGAYAYGSFPDTPARGILEELLEAPTILTMVYGMDGGGASDYDAFCYFDIPYLYFETFDEECWHESCDDADRIDYEHFASLAALSYELTLALANTDIDLVAARDALGCPA